MFGSINKIYNIKYKALYLRKYKFMKRVLSLLISLFVVLSTSSCGVMSELLGYHFDHYDKKYIKDYSEQMDVLRTGFPEIYSLYCNGKIVINEMYHYKTKEGNSMTHIGYYMR